jgi:predicted metal-dependent hydrolase
MDDHTRAADVPPPAGDPTGWRADGRWEHATLRRATVHGVRLFNDGAYHDAHDCFEDEWYNYGQGSTESRFLHGMVQVAAAGLKYEYGDEAGLASLVRSASQYLHGVPGDFYGVDVTRVRERLLAAQRDADAFDGWQVHLDGATPVAGPADDEYVAAIE